MLRQRITALAVTVLLAAGLVVAAAPSAEATSACRQNVYGYGGTGNCVKAIQALVSASSTTTPENDIRTKIPRDGIFGSKTVNAVRKYQAIGGLEVDGRVGANTWDRLCNSGAYWGDDMVMKHHYQWAHDYAC